MAAVTVKPGVELLPKFLYYYLTRFKDEKLVRLMRGTANTSLTIEKLNHVIVSYPGLTEQRAIVLALDHLSGELKALNFLSRICESDSRDLFEDALHVSFSNGSIPSGSTE
jgi:restriction endonuclease S subunit